jgi:hypothetical protein
MAGRSAHASEPVATATLYRLYSVWPPKAACAWCGWPQGSLIATPTAWHRLQRSCRCRWPALAPRRLATAASRAQFPFANVDVQHAQVHCQQLRCHTQPGRQIRAATATGWGVCNHVTHTLSLSPAWLCMCVPESHTTDKIILKWSSTRAVQPQHTQLVSPAQVRPPIIQAGCAPQPAAAGSEQCATPIRK